MTIPEIQARVRLIESAQNDQEYAHELEDSLYIDVLFAISAMPTPAAQLAKAALAAHNLPFIRFYA